MIGISKNTYSIDQSVNYTALIMSQMKHHMFVISTNDNQSVSVGFDSNASSLNYFGIPIPENIDISKLELYSCSAGCILTNTEFLFDVTMVGFEVHIIKGGNFTLKV